MTENEALELMKSLQISKDCELVKTIDFKATVIKALENLQQYRAIGTIEEFKALKEKNVAKKTLHNGANWYRCPNGCEIHKKQFEKDWYCPKCGQKLDWQ